MKPPENPDQFLLRISIQNFVQRNPTTQIEEEAKRVLSRCGSIEIANSRNASKALKRLFP
jgi:hypothetical protein